VNSVNLVARLTRDPESKTTQSDTSVCSLRVAIDRPRSEGADFVDVVLMMADYNLIALGVVDNAHNLIGAISVDDLMEALVPEEWRNRAEASGGV